MAKNAFDRFGITHLSASSLNKWRAAPGWWARHYLANEREETNAAMARGTAVENGMMVWLRTRDMDLAVAAAADNYASNYKGPPDKAEELLIEPMVRGLWKWTPPSLLNAAGCSARIEVKHWFDNIPVPVVGYLDFAFDSIDIDLKTTKMCPSAPRPDHVRQVALYRAARERWGGLLYVTDKKHAYYEVTDEMMEHGLKDLQSTAMSLYHFLARCDTVDDAIKSLPLDWDSFYAPKNKEIAA